MTIGLLAFAPPAFAAAITSAAAGNWEAGVTWVGGVAPGAGENIHGIFLGDLDLGQVRAT